MRSPLVSWPFPAAEAVLPPEPLGVAVAPPVPALGASAAPPAAGALAGAACFEQATIDTRHNASFADRWLLPSIIDFLPAPARCNSRVAFSCHDTGCRSSPPVARAVPTESQRAHSRRADCHFGRSGSLRSPTSTDFDSAAHGFGASPVPVASRNLKRE
jgi:hypothetical protein